MLTVRQWTCFLASLILTGITSVLAYAEEPCPTHDCYPEKGSAEWWAIEAQRPVGSRQKHFFGKSWPPYPRPVGENQEFRHRFHASHYWPYPYSCWDRASVREFSRRQVMNGWTTATTLYDYHFEPDSHQLNNVGRLHLLWIIGNAPPAHHFAFVQGTGDPKANEARLNHVQNEVASISGSENPLSVEIRRCSPSGRPAHEINRIREMELKAMEEPHINYVPTSQLQGGGGGS